MDAEIVSVGHINIAATVHSYIKRILELSITAALRSPFSNKYTVAVKLLDAMVAFVCHIDITAVVYSHTEGIHELAVAVAPATPIN